MSITHEEIQQSLTKKILASIKTFGLVGRTSRAQNNLFSVNSADENDGHTKVCVDEIEFASSITTGERARRFLLMCLKKDVGIWSIGLERTYDLRKKHLAVWSLTALKASHKSVALKNENLDNATLHLELEQRLMQTLVLILKPQPIREDLDEQYNVFEKEQEIGQGTIADSVLKTAIQSLDKEKGQETPVTKAILSALSPSQLISIKNDLSKPKQQRAPDFKECRLSQVGFDQVLAALVPRHLYTMVQQAYPGLTLYPIDQTPEKISIVLPSLETRKYYPKKAKSGEDVTWFLRCPNYQKGFELFSDDPRNGVYRYHFACHIVKFPTTQGVHHGIAHQMPHFMEAKQALEQESKRKEEEKIQAEAALLATKRKKAATTIQKCYKGWQSKKAYKNFLPNYQQKRAEHIRLVSENKLAISATSLSELQEMRDVFLRRSLTP